MKLSTVFVQIALVAAGILVYDQIRSSEPVDSLGPEPSVVRIEAPAPEAAPPPVVLEGKGVGVLVEQMGDVNRRVAELEKQMKGRTVAVADAGYRPAGARGNGTEEPEEGATYVDADGNTLFDW